jgi:hypothetical protein
LKPDVAPVISEAPQTTTRTEIKTEGHLGAVLESGPNMGRIMKSQLSQSNTHGITNTDMTGSVINPPTSQAMKESIGHSTATKGYLHNQNIESRNKHAHVQHPPTGCGTDKSSDQSTSQVRSYLGTSVFFFGPCVIVHKLITHYNSVHAFFELISLLGCRCSQRYQDALLLFCNI